MIVTIVIIIITAAVSAVLFASILFEPKMG